MLQSISGFFESCYNLMLFTLAIWGAARFGMFVIGRSWHWVVKAIVLTTVAASIWGFVGQMTGGTKTDLRIVTEICATAGVIFAAEWGFRQTTDMRRRAGIVAITCLFLAITWSETVDRVIGVARVSPGVVAVPTAAVQEEAAHALSMHSSICDENISAYQREQLCP